MGAVRTHTKQKAGIKSPPDSLVLFRDRMVTNCLMKLKGLYHSLWKMSKGKSSLFRGSLQAVENPPCISLWERWPALAGRRGFWLFNEKPKISNIYFANIRYPLSVMLSHDCSPTGGAKEPRFSTSSKLPLSRELVKLCQINCLAGQHGHVAVVFGTQFQRCVHA